MTSADRQAHEITRVSESGFVRVIDLARELGVSEMTVRRDLDELAEAGAVKRVRGGAMSESVASHPIQERNDVPTGPEQFQVGILVPDVTQVAAGNVADASGSAGAYYFGEIISGARGELERQGVRTRLMFSRSDALPDSGEADPYERRLALDLISRGAQGLLFSWSAPPSSSDDSQRLSWLEELAVPVVLMERQWPSAGASNFGSVRCSHELGAAEAANHLAKAGHRKVALLAHHSSPTASAITSGWRAATDDLGIDQWTYRSQDLADWPGTEAVDAWLDQLLADKVTAVLCQNDNNAFALSERLRARDLHVPRDFSVIAYDDNFAGLFDPPLTAVSPPRAYLGSLAARMLMDQLRDPAHAGISRVEIQPNLVIRESVGTPHI